MIVTELSSEEVDQMGASCIPRDVYEGYAISPFLEFEGVQYQVISQRVSSFEKMVETLRKLG